MSRRLALRSGAYIGNYRKGRFTGNSGSFIDRKVYLFGGYEAAGIDVIKIDVQGFKPMVLRGMRALLDNYRPIMWCETSENDGFRAVSEIEALFPYPIKIMKLVQTPSSFRYRPVLEPVAGRPGDGNIFILPV